MLKQVAELAARLFAITRDIQQNKDDIKDVAQSVESLRRDFVELQRDVRDLGEEVRRLRDEMRYSRDAEAQERKMLMLQLENTLLKFDRRLPAPPPSIEGEPGT